MKKCCDCNSVREDELGRLEERGMSIFSERVCRLVLPGVYEPANSIEEFLSRGTCNKCRSYPWYDADYENMMFDLKSMNN